MKAQKITLIILGAITLILLMIVLSVVGSLSSIAEQRDTNNAKITAIEQEKAIVQSVWDSLQDEYNEKQKESRSFAEMERADGRVQESADRLEEQIARMKEQIAEQSAAIAHDEAILKYLQRLAEESSLSMEEVETLPQIDIEEGRE
jgi:Tfp pilus assembly protein PilE